LLRGTATSPPRWASSVGSVRAANTAQGAPRHRALLIIGTTAFATHNPASLDYGQPPEFNPLLYIPDLLLPIAGFGHKEAFNPRGWEHWLAAGLIAAGWILATTIAADVTRVLSSDHIREAIWWSISMTATTCGGTGPAVNGQLGLQLGDPSGVNLPGQEGQSQT
jgi:hypothetical protein